MSSNAQLLKYTTKCYFKNKSKVIWSNLLKTQAPVRATDNVISDGGTVT